jgi:5-hydroxyisourate hydrolase-like protein (transthyretin family)
MDSIRRRLVCGIVLVLAGVLGLGAAPSWGGPSEEPVGGLHGQVTGPDGTPLAGIEVMARPESGYSSSTTTDAEGRYSLSGLPPQSYVLSFRDPQGVWAPERYDDAFGYEPGTRVDVVAGTDAGPYDATLGRPGSISGIVTGDGVEADDSYLYLYQRDGAQWRWVKTTSSGYTSGRYSFDDLTPGTYRIGVSRPDEPYIDTFYPSADLVENGDDIVVEHGQAVTDADIALLREGAIEGTVTDEQGAPVTGVTVRATDTDMETRYSDAVTDDDGHYRIGPLTTADYVVRFNAYAAGKQSEYYADAPTLYTATPVHVMSGKRSTGIDAQVSARSVLRGTVTDAETGDPIPYARVDLYEKQGPHWQGLSTSAYADRRGRYELTGVWGTYRLLAVDSGYETHGYAFHPAAPSVEEGETVVVAGGAHVTADVGIPMKPQTSTITGTVTSGGDARAGNDVEAELLHEGRWVSMSAATTGADGRYRAFAAVPGTYRVRFSDPTGQLPSRWWDAKATAADATPLVITTGGSQVTGVGIDLGTPPATGRIAGTVTGPTGNPAPDIDVTVYEWDDIAQRWTDVAEARTGASGSYAVANLPADAYRVGFEDDSGLLATEFHHNSPTVQDGMDVQVTGESDAVVDAELAPGPGDIGGVVSRVGASSVEDLRVVAYAHRDGVWQAVAQTRPQPGGQYEIKDLRPGTYRLGFHDDTGSHVDQYWLDQPTLASAQDVVVRPGVTDWGYNAHLRPLERPAYSAETRPVISGVAQVGESLTATPGTWTPAGGMHAYQWLADEVVIPDAVGPQLLLTADLVGRSISVRVTTSGDEADPGAALSDATSPVLPAPVVTTPPSPTPTPTAPSAPPTPTPTPTPAPPPAPPPNPVPVPDAGRALAQVATDLTVTGQPKVGRTVRVAHLVAHLRTSVRYRFQWFARGRKIHQATRPRLKVTRAMLGEKLKVRVTLSAGGEREVVTIAVGKVR